MAAGKRPDSILHTIRRGFGKIPKGLRVMLLVLVVAGSVGTYVVTSAASAEPTPSGYGHLDSSSTAPKTASGSAAPAPAAELSLQEMRSSREASMGITAITVANDMALFENQDLYFEAGLCQSKLTKPIRGGDPSNVHVLSGTSSANGRITSLVFEATYTNDFHGMKGTTTFWYKGTPPTIYKSSCAATR